MAKSLVIVESPAKAKTIQKYLGKDYEVMASKGHIKDLPKRGGVDLENDFQETYEVIEEKGKGEVVKAIRDKAKKVDQVLLAMDPDREGEAIASHIYEEVKARPRFPPGIWYVFVQAIGIMGLFFSPLTAGPSLGRMPYQRSFSS